MGATDYSKVPYDNNSTDENGNPAGPSDYDKSMFGINPDWSNQRSGVKNQLEQMYNEANRAAPTANAAQINTGQSDADRAKQMAFVNQLQQQASGNGPSLAANQLKQGQEQAIAQQMAMLGSQRGSTNAAMAQRQAQLGAANTMQATNAAAANARIQEELNAQGQLGSALQGVRGADQDLATQQAGLNQQTSLANLQAYLQNQQLNQALQAGAVSGLAGLNESELQGQLQYESVLNQDYLSRMGGKEQAAQLGMQEANMFAQGASSAASAGFSMIPMSDEKQKSLYSLSPEEEKSLTPAAQGAADAIPTVNTGMMNPEKAVEAAEKPKAPWATAIGKALAQGSQSLGQNQVDAPQNAMSFFQPLHAQPSSTQADIVNAISNGTISLSPGNMKVLDNGSSNPFNDWYNQATGNTPAPSNSGSDNGYNNWYNQQIANQPISPYARQNANNFRQMAPQTQPTWVGPQTGQLLGQAQPNAERQAMSGGSPAQSQSFLSALQRKQGGLQNNGFMGDTRGNAGTSLGYWQTPKSNNPNQNVSPVSDKVPNTSATMANAANMNGNAVPNKTAVNQGFINPGVLGSQAQSGTPALVPTINAPVVQSAPKNFMPNVFNAGTLSSEQEKTLQEGPHTADKASPQEKAVNTGVAYNKLKEFLDQVDAHQYTYIHPDMPGAGHGTYISPMAQEIEKSDVGKSMVKNVNGTKMVDYGKGFGAMLAAQAMHERRLDNVEQRLADALKKRGK